MACREAIWIPVREIVMRLLVQVGRQPGLSAVYSEILSFDKNEFYLKKSSRITGLTFLEISGMISQGIAAGILTDGSLVLNPAVDMIFSEGDSLLVLSGNMNSFDFDRVPDSREIYKREMHPAVDPSRMLVLSGYSRNINFMLKLLNNYSVDGSHITVAGAIAEEEGTALLSGIDCKGCSINYISIDRTDPDALEDIHPENYDSVMVVSGKKAGMSDEDADSDCIITLLILREIASKLGDSWNTTVVSEIRNPRNRDLATAAGIDDFVISNEVCSMIMAQLVIQPELNQVYEEIFDPSGCEIQLRKASLYNSRYYSSLAFEGLEKGEIVLGWLTGTGTASRVYLNPEKESLLPSDNDTKIVVIAER